MLSIWETHRLEGEAQQARERAQELERRKVAAEAEIRTAADHAVTPVPAKPSAASTTPVFTFGYVGGVPDDYSYRYPRRMVVVPYTYYWPNGQTTTTEILVPAWYEPHHEERSHRRHELTPTP